MNMIGSEFLADNFSIKSENMSESEARKFLGLNQGNLESSMGVEAFNIL